MTTRNSKGKFVKGQSPWNKGKHYTIPNHANKTSFKTAEKHPRYKPIGSERVDRDGYRIIKVAERKWMPKHRYLWQQVYGDIPKSHVVMFKDGDMTNVQLENLMLVSRRALVVFNKKYKGSDNPKLNEQTINLINLELAITDKEGVV